MDSQIYALLSHYRPRLFNPRTRAERSRMDADQQKKILQQLLMMAVSKIRDAEYSRHIPIAAQQHERMMQIKRVHKRLADNSTHPLTSSQPEA